jgi:hypothetical protein
MKMSRSDEITTSRLVMRGLLVAFIAGCIGSTACGMLNSCPEYDKSDAKPVSEGRFAHDPDQQYVDQQQHGPDAQASIYDFPHYGVEQSELEFDREAERVVVTYERDGKRVVETWRVTGYDAYLF